MTGPENPSPTGGPTTPDTGPSLDFAAIREKIASESGPKYWRGLEELAATEEFQSFLDREFPKHASEWDDSLEQGFSRRRFLELGMASLALGGLAACTRQPQEKIVPYVKQPEEVLPGVPLYFASTALHGGYGIGILVESHLGRPTKLEGNPEHPGSLGTTNLFTQSALLDLYDPERTQTVRKLETNKTWLQLTEEITAKLPAWKGLLGDGVRILTETVTSPALADQIGTFLEKHPKAKWIQWEPAGRGAVREASQLAFGQYVETTYDFTKASVVVGLDADFMIDGPGAVRYQHDFATRRRARKDAAEMSRYYAIESTPTSSGTVADHRLPLTPPRVFLFAQALAAALGAPGVEKPEVDMVLSQHVAAASLDLKAAGAAGLVVAGEHAPAALQVLVHAINAALGNTGTTVVYREPAEARPIDQLAALKELVGEMNEGKVETLLIADANPVFTAPPDLGFTEALKKVGQRIHIGRETDETAEYCQWQLPSAHFLETWGDARAFDGTASLVQPVIEPLYGGKSLLEVMDLFLEKARNGHDIVKAYWQKKLGATAFEAAWRKALHDGVLPGGPAAPVTPALKAEAVTAAAGALNAMPKGAFSVVFRPDPAIGDGRFANNGWLQELPKPHTRLVWDNAALIGFSTAEKLGVKNHDVVEIKVGSRSVKAPVWVLQGQAADTITLHLGYGRRKTGKVGTGTGFDAYVIRTSDALSVAAAEVTKTGATYKLVSSQTHFRMEGRDLVRSKPLADFAKEHGGHGYVPKADDTLFLPLYDYSKQVTDHAWGMSIDLTTCIGCNACVIACQAENNIPIVGKDQVSRGREMHWIRIDQYYEGRNPDDPKLYNQPVMCMHCEMAPCEVVCPVGATAHSAEGLNDMAYNRCVGTKYCSNNCPYKVRRFNFYQYSDIDTPVLKLMRNPRVTVRNRGVMEKCTYCTQRINAARSISQREGRTIKDEHLKTACQQVCPSGAIVFGNILDSAAAVSTERKQPHSYGLLAELNTRPRTTYLAKITNPNPELERA